MDQESNSSSLPEKLPVLDVLADLHETMPAIATDLIQGSQDMSNPANQSFAADPDNPLEHAPSWHQFGIITHSDKFLDRLHDAVPEYLESWGLEEVVDSALDEEIGGISKKDLLDVVAYIHDVGKFTSRKISRDDEGTLSTNFEDHEAHSGTLVRGEELRHKLTQHGFTGEQVEYVAVCAELHFELGKVRRVSKAAGGYNVAFAATKEFEAAALEIMDEYPEVALEIGLEFLADSLSKSDVAAVSETDEEIEQERPGLEAQINELGLNPKLINQALQLPVNVKVAEAYLKLWADRQQ